MSMTHLPEEIPLLIHQHRVDTIWHQSAKDQPKLKCRRSDSGIWDTALDHRVLHCLLRAGFYGVYRIGPIRLDHHLVTTLVERWRIETMLLQVWAGLVCRVARAYHMADAAHITRDGREGLDAIAEIRELLYDSLQQTGRVPTLEKGNRMEKIYSFPWSKESPVVLVHTAAIAAGNNGIPVRVHGYEFGKASGMAPRAIIAVYKALYRLFGGYVANVVAAIKQVYEELVQAIKDVEQWLLQLKHARLLPEVDSVLDSSKYVADDVKVEPLDPTQVKVEPLADLSYSVGSKCRFRHTDGRWYDGLIFGLEGSNSAKISFLTPTSENMLVHALTLSVYADGLSSHVTWHLSKAVHNQLYKRLKNGNRRGGRNLKRGDSSRRGGERGHYACGYRDRFGKRHFLIPKYYPVQGGSCMDPLDNQTGYGLANARLLKWPALFIERVQMERLCRENRLKVPKAHSIEIQKEDPDNVDRLCERLQREISQMRRRLARDMQLCIVKKDAQKNRTEPNVAAIKGIMEDPELVSDAELLDYSDSEPPADLSAN
ncbi:unnamed protein product [Camellia sinensis]